MTTSSAWRAFSRALEFASDMRCDRSIGILSRWAGRSARAPIIEGACQLFVDAATRALDAAELDAADVDTIVTISSTGIATPSLEARVAGRMGFRPDVERVPVFGLGCAGGVSGFSIASRLACSRPGSIVLLVAVEVCTLAFRLDELTKANIVATALFGDGAAACVLRAHDGGGAVVEMSGQHTWPDTLDIMGWRIDPQGFGVIFDRAIPPFAQQHIAPAIAGILARGGLALEDVDRFACHPGGAKVIAALERALSLEQGSLDHERAVLADYGNMSSPTVLFVLDRILRAGLPSRTLLTAMGPGFTVKLRFPEESRVTAAALLLGLVTAERIAELFLARRNTAALLAKGAVEVALRALSSDRADARALVSQSVDFRRDAYDRSDLAHAVFLSLQVLRVWILMTLGPRWTTRIIVLPGSRARGERPLSLCLAPKLSRRRGRNRRPAPLPWPALACSHLLRSQRDPAIDPNPCREDRVDRIAPCRTRLSATPRS